MVEKSVERRDEDRSQAWWVKESMAAGDFSIVENSNLSPKRKLYVAYGVIINYLVQAGILKRVNESSLGESRFASRVFVSQEALQRGVLRPPRFIKSALDYAEKHAYDGIMKEGVLEKEGEARAALSMADGASALPRIITDLERVLVGSNVEDFKKRSLGFLANSAADGIYAGEYKIMEICPRTGKVVGGDSLFTDIKKLIYKVLPKREKTFKGPKEIEAQGTIGCPMLASGVFPELVEFAIKDTFSTKVSPPAQPDD